MRKRVIALVFSVCMLVLSVTVTAKSESERLVIKTETPLVSQREGRKISQKLDRISGEHGIDVVILAVDEMMHGSTAKEDAAELYEYMGFGEDGVILYICMEEREVYIQTCGFGTEAVTQRKIDKILDKIEDSLSDGNYADAFNIFADCADEYIIAAKNGEPFNWVRYILISVAIGFVIAFIVTGMWKSELNSVGFRTRATNYISSEGLNITYSKDLFLYSTLDRRPRMDSNSSGSHRSSSGRSYSGKGRKF